MLHNTALLVIDVQTGIFEKSDPFFRKQEILDNVNALLDAAHGQGLPVILVRHGNDSFLAEGSPAWQIHPAVKSLPTDSYINKTHSSVFEEKPFAPLLQEKGIKTLIICGLVSNGCVKAGTLAALERGYGVLLAADAHGTYAAEAEKVIAQWNDTLAKAGARVKPTAKIVKLLYSKW